MAKIDLLTVGIIIVMVSFATLFFIIYYYNQEDKCNYDPLKYSANWYLENTGATKVAGTLILFNGYTSRVINFNEKGIIKKDGGQTPPKNINSS